MLSVPSWGFARPKGPLVLATPIVSLRDFANRLDPKILGHGESKRSGPVRQGQLCSDWAEVKSENE